MSDRTILLPPDVEPTGWLRSAAAHRVRELPPLPPLAATVAPLGAIGPPGSREDRTCDRCRAYVPPTGDQERIGFFTSAYTSAHPLTGARVLLVFGLCRGCMTAEVGAEHIARVDQAPDQRAPRR